MGGGFGGQAPEGMEGMQPPEGMEGMQPPEGMEGMQPPDGFGGTGAPEDMGDMGAMGDMGQMGTMETTDVNENCLIQINGGVLIVEAQGDGIDSNGYVEFNGGEVYVSGPENNGEGALDYELGCSSNGATVIAAGPTGMALSCTDGTQAFALVQASGDAGATIEVQDASGTVLASMTSTHRFDCVVVSCEGLEEGGTYQLVVDETSTEFTASTESTMGGMGGMGGQMGPMGGQGEMGDMGGERPERSQMPDDDQMPGGGERGQMPGGGQDAGNGGQSTDAGSTTA